MSNMPLSEQFRVSAKQWVDLNAAAEMLEVKTKLPHLMIDIILKDKFPAEHVAQCQGALWVAEREWIDIAVYWPGIPMYTRRAYRDDAYIERLSAAVDAFNDELQEIVAKVRKFGQAG